MGTNDGIEVGFHGEYREIVPNELIVSTEIYEGAPGPGTLNTLTLSDAKSKASRDAIIASRMEDGLQDALELLEQVAIG